MLKKVLLIFLCSVVFTSLSQERRTLVVGEIVDTLSVVKNANIINLKTNQGTFSSDTGLFRMFVKKGDSLRISSIQHITKFIVIDKTTINTKAVTVKLIENTVVLDTFELKRNHLFGRLGVDSKSVPTNRKDSLLRDLMDFSKINMKVVAPDDHITKMKPPINNVDPTARFAGVGASALIPFKDSARLWALRKELARRKAFPYQILSELGEKFFFEELKIPIEKYFHFLEYCNSLGIEELHKDKKVLEIIKIFQSESKTYLEIIKND